MKTYKHNGETWYCDVQPLLKRVRRWFVYFGGWESPYHMRAGYTYRWRGHHALRLALRARGDRSRLFALYHSLCPISILGGRLVCFDFGINYYRRRVKGWYCFHYAWKKDDRGRLRKRWYAYRSHNATPSGADTWYLGVPYDVVRVAEIHHEEMTLDREIREAREAQRGNN